MNSAKRAVEWTKTALIALLFVSAVLLGWQTGLSNDFFSPIADLVASTPEPVPATEAARPLVIVITDENGARYGIKYDTARRNSIYDSTRGIFGEALGSASLPVEIGADAWREALRGPGIYFEYITPVRLSVLDRWLDARMPILAEDIAVRRIFVAFGENWNRLYFQDEESGRFFGADTSSSAARAQDFGMQDPNGAMFAFETSVRAAESAPFMIIMPGYPHPYVRAVGTGSLDEQIDVVISTFGHDGEATRLYFGGDGTMTRFGTRFSVRAEPNGRVVYRRTGGLSEEEGEALSECEMIERARASVERSIGETSGAADVFFELFEHNEDGSFSVTFGYYLTGGRVHMLEDGFAARITFTAGVITEAELNFKNFSFFPDEYSALLPEIQALAAAGGEFMLSYSYMGLERLEPVWARPVF